jgi:hypothetical protein
MNLMGCYLSSPARLVLLLVLGSAGQLLAQATNDAAAVWIRQLGSAEYQVRDRAEQQLQALGAAAVPLLRQHQDSADPEVRWRVARLLAAIGPDVRAFLAAKGRCVGQASEGETVWPCVLTVTEFEPATGKFRGTIQWLSLNALHAIEGQLGPETLTFRETKFIRRGNAMLECVYTLALKTGVHDNPTGRLRGTWTHPGGSRGGEAELEINRQPADAN